MGFLFKFFGKSSETILMFKTILVEFEFDGCLSVYFPGVCVVLGSNVQLIESVCFAGVCV